MAEDLLLGVTIKVFDYFTGPLRSMVSQVTAAEGKMKSINNTMKLMGKSKSEIDAINASLNRMADQKAFANVASDLQKAGMARQDVAAMEGSYMRMRNYQREMASAQASYAAGKDLAMSGVGNLTTAAMGGFGIFEMVKKAGEYQSNMATIQDSTGATAKQMDDFSNAIMKASAQVSKFNDFQMAQIAQTLTSGGFSNIKQAQSLLLPTAKFAEVQMYENKATDPIESTKQAIEMAHLFKNYDPKSFQNFLNTFNKYSLMQPGDSTQLEQTLKYLAPTAQTMGMKADDILSLSAVANRIGLSGSHGGTNAADMILRLIPGLVGGSPTKKKTPKAWQAMQDLGFIDSKGNSQFFDKNGKVINLNGMLTTMINDSKKMNPMQLQQKYHDIFGIQGGRAAAILADPKTMEQLTQMRTQLGKTKSMDKIHADHQNTAAGQINQLKSNSMTLMLRVGQQLAISLNPAIKSINTLLGKMLAFSQAHPQVAKIIGDFALLMVGGKALEGVFKIFAGNIKMVGAAFKMLKITSEAGELTKFGKVVGMLKGPFTVVKDAIRLFGSTSLTAIGEVLTAIGPIGWAIMAVVAAGALLYAAWKTDFGGIRETTKKVLNDIKKFFTDLFHGNLSKLPGDMLKLGGDIIHGLMNGIKAAAGAVGNVIGGIAHSISGTFKKILGIASPSKVFMEHGKFIVQGLSMGIDRNSRMAHKATMNLANGVNQSFNSKGGLALAGSGNVEIHIHPHPHQRAEDIADMVVKKLGKSSRRSMMNTGTSVNMGAF